MRRSWHREAAAVQARLARVVKASSSSGGGGGGDDAGDSLSDGSGGVASNQEREERTALPSVVFSLPVVRVVCCGWTLCASG
jgi:hypothetical protein